MTEIGILFIVVSGIMAMVGVSGTFSSFTTFREELCLALITEVILVLGGILVLFGGK